MYHIYKNDKEITKVNWWCDVVEYIEQQGLSRRYDCNQSDANHWYFTNSHKAIEVELKDE